MKVRCRVCKCLIGEREPYGGKFDEATVFGSCEDHREKGDTSPPIFINSYDGKEYAPLESEEDKK